MLKIKRAGTFGNHLQLQARACLHRTFIALIMTLYCSSIRSRHTTQGKDEYKWESEQSADASIMLLVFDLRPWREMLVTMTNGAYI